MIELPPDSITAIVLGFASLSVGLQNRLDRLAPKYRMYEVMAHFFIFTISALLMIVSFLLSLIGQASSWK